MQVLPIQSLSSQQLKQSRWTYTDLHQHFLGPNNVDNMAANKAEQTLQMMTYYGEQRRLTFEKFVNLRK
jgi:hypothetical protein